MNPQPAWISIDTRVPKSGQTVEARVRNTRKVHVVTSRIFRRGGGSTRTWCISSNTLSLAAATL